MGKRVIISGLCPESGKIQRVEASLECIDLCGSMTSEYKVTSFFCAYEGAHGCAATDDTMRGCPLYRKAEAGRT